jgi:UV DNA damage endonuclease
MVLDVHHHHLLNCGESLESLLPAIFATWGDLTPKIHLSSPRDPKSPRSHADFIETGAAVDLLHLTGTPGTDFDLMLEVKQKDLALVRLADDLQKLGFELSGYGEIHL